MSLLELFCHVDDFWQSYAPQWEQELLRSGMLTIDGYYDGLLAFFDHSVTEKFVTQKHRAMLLTSGQPDQLLDLILNYQPTYSQKWVDRSEV